MGLRDDRGGKSSGKKNKKGKKGKKDDCALI